MRIISKFRDYYDHIQVFGQEPIVYNRKTQVFWRETQECKDFSIVNFDSWTAILIGFCGKIVPYIRIYENHKPQILLADAAKEYILSLNFRIGNPKMNNLFRFLEDDSQQALFYPLFKKYKIPVFSVSPGRWVEFNPNLKELRFDVYMGAGEVLQAISSFIGTDLKESMELNKQTDKQKVVSHGFDAITSFRPKIKLKTH